MMHHSGECINIGQFSRELVGGMIDDYVTNAEAVSPRRWTKLINICGGQGLRLQDPIPSSSSMQQKRRTLYVRSSPAIEELSA